MDKIIQQNYQTLRVQCQSAEGQGLESLLVSYLLERWKAEQTDKDTSGQGLTVRSPEDAL